MISICLGYLGHLNNCVENGWRVSAGSQMWVVFCRRWVDLWCDNTGNTVILCLTIIMYLLLFNKIFQFHSAGGSNEKVILAKRGNRLPVYDTSDFCLHFKRSEEHRHEGLYRGYKDRDELDVYLLTKKVNPPTYKIMSIILYFRRKYHVNLLLNKSALNYWHAIRFVLADWDSVAN